eukprot:jgi/Botrbrau1/20377/Bobra.0006s0040.1
MCSSFRIHATLSFSAWASGATTVCATVLGGQLADVFGTTFLDAKNCTTLDHRPAGTIYGPYMTAAGSQGAVTGDQNAVLVLAFSEPIAGLSSASFSVSGPTAATVKAIKLLPGTKTFYHVFLALPPDYYGTVTVSLTGIVYDVSGRSNRAVDPFTFTRVIYPLLQGAGFHIVLPPSLLNQA